MDKLKPCPFCGDKQHVTHVELSNGLHYVECKRCGAAPHRLGAWDYETAVKYWNSVNRWIPCSERLPEKSGQYLVCAIYVGVSLASFDRDKREWGYWQDDPCGWNGEKWIEIDEVTHWMPLPEPPKEDENE